MKLFIYLFILSNTLLFSCQKETGISREENFQQQLWKELSDSLSKRTFAQLDEHRVIQTKVESRNVVRIGLKGRSMKSEFVMVEVDNEGHIKKGSVIQLQGKEILRSDLRQLRTVTRTIRVSGASTSAQRPPSQEDPYIELPEVVIISSYGNGGISWSEWFNLISFLDYAGESGGYGYYNNGDPFLSAGGGGNSSSGGSGDNISSGGNSAAGGDLAIVRDHPIRIDYESQYADPAIKVEEYMKCFSDVPDGGATGSIEIFADIPVNGDPGKFFDWSNGSPGHVFIQLTKENSGQHVSQYIGFYPVSGWKTALTTAPINGKFVDNGNHEFNASFKVNLNATQLQAVVTHILYLSRFVRYDIDEYNCADWALEVFNSCVRPEEKLENVPKFDLPGGAAPFGTVTPQGIYMLLQHKKNSGGAAAPQIQIPLVGWAGASHGPCQ